MRIFDRGHGSDGARDERGHGQATGAIAGAEGVVETLSVPVRTILDATGAKPGAWPEPEADADGPARYRINVTFQMGSNTGDIVVDAKTFEYVRMCLKEGLIAEFSDVDGTGHVLIGGCRWDFFDYERLGAGAPGLA